MKRIGSRLKTKGITSHNTVNLWNSLPWDVVKAIGIIGLKKLDKFMGERSISGY